MNIINIIDFSGKFDYNRYNRFSSICVLLRHYVASNTVYLLYLLYFIIDIIDFLTEKTFYNLYNRFFGWFGFLSIHKILEVNPMVDRMEEYIPSTLRILKEKHKNQIPEKELETFFTSEQIQGLIDDGILKEISTTKYEVLKF